MSILKNRSGSALFMALLGIVILSALAVLMVKRGTFGMKDTTGFKTRQTAFQAAEAGLEHARKLLNDDANADPNGSWDLTLAASQSPEQYIGTINTADTGLTNNNASYTVDIADNLDDDPSMIVDSDKIIVVTSTGTSGNKTVVLTALMKNNAQDRHISQEHYGERSQGVAQGESGTVTGTNRGNL